MANVKPKYYCQWAPAWGRIPYTIDGDYQTETIGKSGCGPTSMAMILATWVKASITPVDTCAMAITMRDRTADDGTEWEFFGHVANKYKMKFKQTASTDDAVAALKAGAYVICSMKKGYFTQHGHFILAWNVDSTNIYVNDPNNQGKDRATIGLFRQQCAQYFIFYKPSGAVATTNTIDTIGEVQSALNKLGFKGADGKTLSIDGQVGKNTKFAVQAFQKKYGLTVDGIPGLNTMAKLQGLVNKK